MNNYTKGLVDQLYQDRLGTLLSVQDMVEAIINALEVNGRRRAMEGARSGGGQARGTEMGGWENNGGQKTEKGGG